MLTIWFSISMRLSLLSVEGRLSGDCAVRMYLAVCWLLTRLWAILQSATYRIIASAFVVFAGMSKFIVWSFVMIVSPSLRSPTWVKSLIYWPNWILSALTGTLDFFKKLRMSYDRSSASFELSMRSTIWLASSWDAMSSWVAHAAPNWSSISFSLELTEAKVLTL